MKASVESHRNGVVFFISKKILVNPQLIQVITKAIMIQNHLVVAAEDSLQKEKVQKVRRRKGEKLRDLSNQKFLIIKDITLESEAAFVSIITRRRTYF